MKYHASFVLLYHLSIYKTSLCCRFCQSDIDELAALIDRFNDSIIKQNSGLSQIHFDIIWKVDFVTSQIPEKDKLDMRNIQKSIESFNNIVRLLKPRTESAEAVG